MLVLFATLGPLVVTNILWFKSLDRIGASRATLATNLQPFLAALFAVVLLGETIDAIQVAGGLLIGSGSSPRGDARPSPRASEPATDEVRCADDSAATRRARLGRRRRWR